MKYTDHLDNTLIGLKTKDLRQAYAKKHNGALSKTRGERAIAANTNGIQKFISKQSKIEKQQVRG